MNPKGWGSVPKTLHAAFLLMHCDKCGRDVCRLCVKKLRMMCILEVKRLKHLALVRLLLAVRDVLRAI
eukprot:2627211-Prymnesium_polylepis.1